jgi:hypothetical protein
MLPADLLLDAVARAGEELGQDVAVDAGQPVGTSPVEELRRVAGEELGERGVRPVQVAVAVDQGHAQGRAVQDVIGELHGFAAPVAAHPATRRPKLPSPSPRSSLRVTLTSPGTLGTIRDGRGARRSGETCCRAPRPAV